MPDRGDLTAGGAEGGAALVLADGVSAGYGSGPTVLRDVSLRLGAGERLGVLGPNGGGKTTLLRLLGGELAPRSGTLRLSGRCGTVPQSDRSRLDYPVSALDVALMGSLASRPWWRRPGRGARRAALAALGAVGMREHASRTFGELSGGQRQRVLVARALVQDARIVLFDEPFTGLDSPSARRLDELIDALAAEGRAVLICTHDVGQALRWDRVLCLNSRQVALGEPRSTLTEDVLAATYGEALLRVPASGAAVALTTADHHGDD